MTNSNKYYLFIFSVLILLFSRTAYSQSFELYHNDTLVNNDTILIRGDVTADSLHTYIFQGDTTYYYAYEVDIEIDVKNISYSTLAVQTKKRHVSIIPETENYFCWETCYAPYTFESVLAIAIEGNETSDIYSAHYKPKGKLGNILVAYTFFDDLNPNDSATVMVEYMMDEASSIPENIKNDPNISLAYPNPCQHTLCFNNLKPSANSYTIMIFDRSGKRVKEIEILASDALIQVDINDLTSGLYLYTIVSDHDYMSSGKFSKLP